MHRMLLVGFFLAFLGSSAVAACGGDEDTTPTPNEGTSGSGGSSAGSGGSSSGSSGSAGNAGQGGSVGDAGATGDGGAAGDAGQGGDAGTAGDGGSGGAAAGAGGSDAGAGGSDAGSGGAAAGSGGSNAGSGGAGAGSGGSDAGSGGSPGSGGQAAPGYETDVKPIFMQKCAPCHTSGSSGGLNFTNYSDTQKSANVCAGKTKGECALIRIQNGSMPQGKGCTGDPAQDAAKPGCFIADEQAKIQAWIDGGQNP